MKLNCHSFRFERDDIAIAAVLVRYRFPAPRRKLESRLTFNWTLIKLCVGTHCSHFDGDRSFYCGRDIDQRIFKFEDSGSGEFISSLLIIQCFWWFCRYADVVLKSNLFFKFYFCEFFFRTFSVFNLNSIQSQLTSSLWQDIDKLVFLSFF